VIYTYSKDPDEAKQQKKEYDAAKAVGGDEEEEEGGKSWDIARESDEEEVDE
jgi:hypothetical protein